MCGRKFFQNLHFYICCSLIQVKFVCNNTHHLFQVILWWYLSLILNKQEMDLVTPSFGLIFWTSIVFIILLVLLKKIAWTPILENVDARNRSIDEALSSAKKARSEMSNMKNENERILKNARFERDKILSEARDISAKIVSEAKNVAKEEADKMISSAKSVIENEKSAAVSELKNTVGTLSVEIAEKILKTELKDSKNQNSYINNMLKDIKLN